MLLSVLLLKLTLLFNFSAFHSGEPVTVTQQVPASAVPGSEFTVEVIIHKANVSGFAKYQVELPDGFKALAVEVKNAAFSFADKKVKFIWMALPSEQEFKISYKVRVPADASGNYPIGGTFAYVENNETQKFILSPVSVFTGGSGEKATETENKPAETTEVQTAVPQPAETQHSEPVKPAENIQTANDVQPAVEEKPAEPETKITESATTSTTENQSKTETPVAPVNTTTETATPVPVENKNTGSSEKAPVNPAAAVPKEMPKTPAPVISGILYRVQLAIFDKTAEADYFQKNYRISEPVYAEQVDGKNKYVVGNFKVYSDAKSLCNTIKQQGLADAFVVAYRNGKRITVPEALSITKQKWVP